jgi:hypothetical protein
MHDNFISHPLSENYYTLLSKSFEIYEVCTVMLILYISCNLKLGPNDAYNIANAAQLQQGHHAHVLETIISSKLPAETIAF